MFLPTINNMTQAIDNTINDNVMLLCLEEKRIKSSLAALCHPILLFELLVLQFHKISLNSRDAFI